ncbi:MAG: pantoate--beta-alanine ligase [Gammaproteobacteria bacterium]|nr:MAG: pantoate--beta-alanine ligase [Gammaproteobacteria bacterium]
MTRKQKRAPRELQLCRSIDCLRQELAALTMQGESLALVPTMGNLHAGHLSLVKAAGKLADRVVVSIFVNPLQFDRAEDLAAYPRTLEADVEALRRLPCDLVFAPESGEIYPDPEHATRVHVPVLSEILEGASRPGHFDGVATIVARLFNLVQPDIALFGEKDYQQLLLIRRMVDDLDFPVQVLAMPTVREEDGLAMSSRNGLLTPEQRKQAPALYAALKSVAEALASGRTDFETLEREAEERLKAAGLRPDYIRIRDAEDLSEPRAGRPLIVLGAAWLGEVRLIDNILPI